MATEEPETLEMTQPNSEEPDAEPDDPSPPTEAVWARLIALAPPAVIHEVRKQCVVLGRTTNPSALVKIDDQRIRHARADRSPLCPRERRRARGAQTAAHASQRR